MGEHTSPGWKTILHCLFSVTTLLNHSAFVFSVPFTFILYVLVNCFCVTSICIDLFMFRFLICFLFDIFHSLYFLSVSLLFLPEQNNKDKMFQVFIFFSLISFTSCQSNVWIFSESLKLFGAFSGYFVQIENPYVH